MRRAYAIASFSYSERLSTLSKSPRNDSASSSVIPTSRYSYEFMSTQNGQAAAYDAVMRMSLSMRLVIRPSSCATKASIMPEPMAAFGYQARIRAGSMILPVIFSENQIPSLRMSGIRSDCLMNAYIFSSALILKQTSLSRASV